jgi:feruloyl esterase
VYHGWADQQVASGSSVEFYKAVLDESGGLGQTSDWVRLFMAPGMAHCSGGEGPDTFGKISLIEQRVERGNAPEQIIAAHKTACKIDRTRPLCPYPQVAHTTVLGASTRHRILVTVRLNSPHCADVFLEITARVLRPNSDELIGDC